MTYVAKVPKLGLEMKSDELLVRLVSEGDKVAEGDPIAEIESERTTVEIDAKENGVLWHVALTESESTAPGGALVIIAGADEDISGLEADASVGEGGSEPVATGDSAGDSSPTEATETTGTATIDGEDASLVAQSRLRESDGASESGEVYASLRAKRLVDNLGVDLTAIGGTGLQGAVTESDVEAATGPATTAAAEKRVFALPNARCLARELSVDVEAVERTGQNGRVTKSDVRAAGGAITVVTNSLVAGVATTVAADATTAGESAETERPLSGMRRAVAGRLGENYREVVHATVDRRADAEELLAAVSAAADALGVNMSITNVLLLALSASFDEHPEFNAIFEDGVYRPHGEHNVYIAVGVNEGLITPVVCDIASLSLSELIETHTEAIQRALSGDFTMDDLLGGTFTVSNPSVLGVGSFDPIINSPQAAILGANTIHRETIPVDDGDVVARRVTLLPLSFGHRTVDGADAARMLGALVEHVENSRPFVIAAGER